jgi:DNA repair exonuclease SbcCD ATPase subunit
MCNHIHHFEIITNGVFIQAERQEATAQSDAANDRVAKIEANLKQLEETLVEATNKKIAAEKEAVRLPMHKCTLCITP